MGKIMLAQLIAQSAYFMTFMCLVFLIDLITWLIEFDQPCLITDLFLEKNFQKLAVFQIVTIFPLSLPPTLKRNYIDCT